MDTFMGQVASAKHFSVYLNEVLGSLALFRFGVHVHPSTKYKCEWSQKLVIRSLGSSLWTVWRRSGMHMFKNLFLV